MTFYEAAVEVLRRSGRPLHYKKITEIAVREELLSHVGKTPHVTMGDRLEREIKKDEDTIINQMRPGVFKLDEEYAEQLTRKIQKERKKKQRERRNQRQSSPRDPSQSRETRTKDEDNVDDENSPKRRRSRGSQQNQAQRKQKDDGHAPGESSKQQTRKGQDDEPRRRRSRGGDDPDASGGDHAASSSRSSSAGLPDTKHLEEGPVALSGIPRAAHQVLAERDGRPMPIDELAEAIFERDLVKFHTHDQVTTVTSALANDNQVRTQHGHRPLFERDDEERWGLTEWNLDDEIIAKERGILGLSEEIRQSTVEQLGRSLLDLKAEALEHLALTLLERLGYHNIKVSKRSSEGDVFFTADWRQGLADVRVCVQVATGEKETLQPDAVHELRETLNHYSASEGVIIHLNDVSDQAIEQSREEENAPITLLDRDNFVELLLKHGIGVREYSAPIVMLDTDFIDALRD